MLAVVLSRRDWQEFDQIISLYTWDKGHLEVVARGVKKITSKNSACLEPGFLIDAEIVSGREIDYLVKADIRENFKNCREDLSKITIVGHVLQLFDKNIYPEKRDDNLFNLLVNFLYFCESTVNINRRVVLAFVLKFIYYLGFRPELEVCTECGRSFNQTNFNFYFFSYNSGGLICPKSGCLLELNKEGVRLSAVELQTIKVMLEKDWETINFLDQEVLHQINVKKMVYGFFGYCLNKKVAFLP